MDTAKLGEILRQKDPALKDAVEQLARGDVHGGIAVSNRRAASTRSSIPKRSLIR